MHNANAFVWGPVRGTRTRLGPDADATNDAAIFEPSPLTRSALTHAPRGSPFISPPEYAAEYESSPPVPPQIRLPPVGPCGFGVRP